MKIRETAAGRSRLWFERGSGSLEVVADWVVLAVPFAVLETVDYVQAGFDSLIRVLPRWWPMEGVRRRLN